MSFAGPKDPLIERGIEAVAAKGIVMVAAAGNAGIKSPPLYPAANPHVIAVSATDAAGPFAPVPEDMMEKAKLQALSYGSVIEALAEKFHTTPAVIQRLNPGVERLTPGTVVAVPVADGARVETGDTVVVVEAMKMEHRLVAPAAGTVSVQVAPGDLVRLDQVVARVDAEEPATASTSPFTDVPPEEADAAPAPPAAAQR